MDTPCEEWPGPVDVYGYAVKTRRKDGLPNIHASRWVWEQAHGPIEPRTLHVHHRCHNLRCVALDHLELKDPSTHKREHMAEDGLTGVSAVNAAKTTCAKGHPFDKHTGKQRACSICRRESSREWARRKRASAC